jgi:monoamine oxidase
MAAAARHDVVVVGAGLAGLTAALELEAAGADVVVLEAQQRVGGRVRSMDQPDTQREAGGTYIGAGYRRVIGAAERYGVPLIDVTPILQFFREQDLAWGGRIIRQAEWPAHPDNPFPEADKALMPWTYHRVLGMRHTPLEAPERWLDFVQSADDASVHDWMRGLGLSERAIALAYDMNPSFGNDARDISVLMLFFRAAFSKSQRALAPEGVVGYTARDGVQRIPEAMAGALRRPPEVGRQVTAIAADARGAELRCADGARYRAAQVVCSLPFGVLRRVAIDPPLHGAQAEAIRQLASQPITQVYLRPKTPFWQADGYAPSLYTDSVAGMVAAARSSDGDPSEVTSLTAWAMGRNAAELDELPAAEVGRRVIDAIERVRPAAKGQLELIGVQSWGRDPYAAGGWAYFRPGEPRKWLAAMGAAHGRITFCGEHLARLSRGMEGAMESGEGAAAEVLAACRT